MEKVIEKDAVYNSLLSRIEEERAMNIDKAYSIAVGIDPNITRKMVYPGIINNMIASGQVSRSGCVLTYTGT